MYGDLKSAALFIVEGQQGLIDLYRSVGEDSNEFYSLFEMKMVNADKLVEILVSTFRSANVEVDPYLKSLKALSTASKLYRNFPNATVNIRVLQQRLYDAAWVKDPSVPHRFSKSSADYRGLVALQPYILDRKKSFACITMFESGRYNVQPPELENVMAISSGDSLFIGNVLLYDPFENWDVLVHHVPGNIGRAGIAFLVPPVDPLIKKSSLEEWPQINHNKFDGELKNSFESTSLHLRFTGAETPLNVGFTGAQDSVVNVLETLISVHEYGRWIADLNPLVTAPSSNLVKLPPSCSSTCKAGDPKLKIICIDNWLELIDTPEEKICLVRAHKNWQARLAATSMSIQMGFDTVIMAEHVCWGCFDEMLKHLWGVTMSRTNKIIVIG